MFFSLQRALDALPELGPRTRGALEALLPGAVTLLLPNPLARYPLACGRDPWTLGLRVPAPGVLADVAVPVMQSSANLSGGADPRSLDEVDDALREGADLVVDGGELPGTPSTVVDLRAYGSHGTWSVLREGAVATDAVARALALLPSRSEHAVCRIEREGRDALDRPLPGGSNPSTRRRRRASRR